MTPFAQKFIAALRSGEFHQGGSVLLFEDDREKNFCFIGVACELLVREGRGRWNAYDDTPSQYWFSDNNGNRVAANPCTMKPIVEELDLVSIDQLLPMINDNDDGVKFDMLADDLEQLLLARETGTP